jgi:hypothetical protein
MGELERACRRLIEAFDHLGIRYLVGGSAASSVHGWFRSTADIDFVAEISEHQVRALVEQLGPEFYADPDMIVQALSANRSFNLIHTGSAYKFDVFPLSGDPFHQAQLARRRIESLSLGIGENVSVAMATPEDTILAKLVWYRRGGGVSERQWNDVKGVIAVQGERLDRSYMREWAARLGVADLLERAFSESL